MRLLRSFFDTQQLGLQESLLERSMYVQRLKGTCVMPPFWPCSTYSRSPVFSSRMPVSPRYEPAANMAERSGLHAIHDMMPAVQGPNKNTPCLLPQPQSSPTSIRESLPCSGCIQSCHGSRQKVHGKNRFPEAGFHLV